MKLQICTAIAAASLLSGCVTTGGPAPSVPVLRAAPVPVHRHHAAPLVVTPIAAPLPVPVPPMPPPEPPRWRLRWFH